jgi:hypothetical protein
MVVDLPLELASNSKAMLGQCPLPTPPTPRSAHPQKTTQRNCLATLSTHGFRLEIAVHLVGDVVFVVVATTAVACVFAMRTQESRL